jgi:DNA-binding Lrp family transcriptional regulator
MSFQAMTWAVEQELPAMQKIVLLMLANRTGNESGICYPSHDLLAKECGMSKRSVVAQIDILEKAGLIKVFRSFNDKKMKNVNKYKLNLHVKTSVSGSAGDALGSAGDALGGSAGDALKPVTIEPVKETKEKVPPSSEEVTTPKKAKAKKDPKDPTQSQIDAEKVANYFAKKITDYNPKAVINPKSWIKDIELAIRKDGIDPKELCEVIQWIYTEGTFWIPNVLCGKTLREKYTKLSMQKMANKTNVSPITQPKRHFMEGAHFAKII